MELTQLKKDGLFYLALLLGPLGALLFIKFSAITPLLLSLQFLLLTIIVYPILEEIIFRGQIQPWLLKKPTLAFICCNISLANLITSLLFGVLHIIYRSSALDILVVLPSLIFGFFYERYKSIIPSTILHIFYNASLIMLL